MKPLILTIPNMSKLTIIQPKESAVAVNQLALFLDSAQVAEAKEKSKDLLAEIADAVKRIKQLAKKHPDLEITKNFETIPLHTFQFICNQYKLESEYYYGRFQAFIIISKKWRHHVEINSELTKLELKEIETIKEGGVK